MYNSIENRKDYFKVDARKEYFFISQILTDPSFITHIPIENCTYKFNYIDSTIMVNTLILDMNNDRNSKLENGKKDYVFLYLSVLDIFLSFNYSDVQNALRYYIQDTDYNESFISALERKINVSLDNLGYKTIPNPQALKNIIVIKNSLVETVASNRPNIAWKLFDFSAYNATIEDKEHSLVDLYKEFEPIRSKFKDSYLKTTAANVGELIQCVRHSKDTKDKETKYPFYYSNTEEWCNNIFNWMLECFVYVDNQESIKLYKKLRK